MPCGKLFWITPELALYIEPKLCRCVDFRSCACKANKVKSDEKQNDLTFKIANITSAFGSDGDRPSWLLHNYFVFPSKETFYSFLDIVTDDWKHKGERLLSNELIFLPKNAGDVEWSSSTRLRILIDNDYSEKRIYEQTKVIDLCVFSIQRIVQFIPKIAQTIQNGAANIKCTCQFVSPFILTACPGNLIIDL